MKRTLYLIIILWIAVLAFVGCDKNRGHTSTKEAIALIEKVSHQGDDNRTLVVADSLEKAGVLSESESYFWQGYAYYRMNHTQSAEFYWKESLNATKNSTEAGDLATYARAASYLTSLYCRFAFYSNALKTAEPAVNRLEALKCDTTSDYTNLLVFIGYCKTYFGSPDSLVTPILERAYQMHLANIDRNHSKGSYRDCIVGLINIIYTSLYVEKYEQGLMWTDRLGKILEEYKTAIKLDESYFDKQWARYLVFHALALEGLGRSKEAADDYAQYQKTNFAHTVEGQVDAGDYLAMSKNWKEAARSFRRAWQNIEKSQMQLSLEMIQRHLLKEYHADVKAGLPDSANMVAVNICERLDSVIIRSRLMDAEEQETIHQKESQIAEREILISKMRLWYAIVIIAVLSIVFLAYTIYRNRVQRRLSEAHENLKVAYDQLEETTTAKERMESELRIARDIQMSMVPSTFPKREGLDMFAYMTPAKEVGGDLYGYQLEGDKLYFAIGDVSGKGVPASLFMAQATRLFLTLVKQNMMPAEICTRINDALSGEDNKNNMFVTLFIGMLDLQTGHLSYCNAGHDAPYILPAAADSSLFTFHSSLFPFWLWRSECLPVGLYHV